MRITVGLTPRSEEELSGMEERLHSSKTYLVNRGIHVLFWIETELEQPNTKIIVERDGVRQQVHLL